MLLTALALTAALGVRSPSLPTVPVGALAADTLVNGAVNAPMNAPMNAYVVDCQVSGEALTDCKVVDADPQTNVRAATALKLAAEIHLPSGMAVSNPGRIKIRLNVNP
jgi:hypothetical protein